MIDLSYICSDATVFSGKSRVIFFSNPICEHTRGNFYLFYLNYIINTFAPKNCGTRRCKPFGLHINCRKKIDCLHVQLSYILCKNKSRKRHMDAHAITLAWLANALT
ncbi:AAC_collapsed_G0023210.mRNA.1.CDS.1 [Saccharomyces cerevisiae]|nr:AAC_HP1_G0023880.mRNA.1.CDS.1 [Saccharomyces cerevisiae]CAI6702691.1 AAC_collapsed_G0023210.mRNA.1.CDS.1 [Saccharomyces cerevisiae]